jgi:hypothetical protein
LVVVAVVCSFLMMNVINNFHWFSSVKVLYFIG